MRKTDSAARSDDQHGASVHRLQCLLVKPIVLAQVRAASPGHRSQHDGEQEDRVHWLGDMGLPMARRLLQHGLTVFSCANRRRQPIEVLKLAGLVERPDPRAVAKEVDVLLTIVLDEKQTDTVLGRTSGPPLLFDAALAGDHAVWSILGGLLSDALRTPTGARHELNCAHCGIEGKGPGLGRLACRRPPAGSNRTARPPPTGAVTSANRNQLGEFLLAILRGSRRKACRCRHVEGGASRSRRSRSRLSVRRQTLASVAAITPSPVAPPKSRVVFGSTESQKRVGFGLDIE